MSKHIAFVTDPLEQINPQTDTTFTLMKAAQDRGYKIFWMEASDLHIKNNIPVGYMASIKLHDEPNEPFSLGESFLAPLEQLALIWWRKSPPYSLDLLFALDALQMLPSKTLVLNDPRTLRQMNEHLFSLQFPNCVPPSLVTKNPNAIRGFISEIKGKTVVRRLDSPSHHSSFVLRMGDPNLKMLTQVLTEDGTQYVAAQQMVTESGLDGDKRIFMINGEFLGIALQIPAMGDMRGSFERGAEVAATELSDKDHKLISTIGPTLRKNGIFFATMDVANGLIFNFNFSSPGGLSQLASVSDLDPIETLFTALELKLSQL